MTIHRLENPSGLHPAPVVPNHATNRISGSDGTSRALSGDINKDNARSVLSELLKQPPGADTYQARLACLQADPSIQSWEALTRDPEALKVLQKNDWNGFTARLAEPGVWLPEVDNLNTNILKNLTATLGGQYAATFQSLLLGSDPIEKKDVALVRGAPSAGKTSFLKGRFALGADDVKNMIQNRLPGLTMPQVHTQGAALLQSFLGLMEHKFDQALTRDALYLWPKDFDGKLDSAAARGEQKVAVHDIQVDLTTVCCRILKRSTDEAVMNFDTLSTFFRASLENRPATLAAVEKNREAVSEYSLTAWDGTKPVTIAERAPGSDTLEVKDAALFAEHLARDPASIRAEIQQVRDTVIDQGFINRFVRDLDPTTAKVFTEALSRYEGRTLSQALELHANKAHVPTSIAARVLEHVLPG
ncbi:hypothetical protein HX864_25265 [Pseudomonas yamanorum]|uniref:hypothetical protein n=1 Tax=Pseudomonas yamanorum TaxID=515393 RepID=UPI0015A1AAD7|nr:hypothetical protein [Pseudomonas yamanorum]NWD26603.1 hypothetical protein [Pseudomonas yamanorum]